MATERLAPDAILVQTGLSGAVSAIQDDPDSPDGSWLTAPGSNTPTELRVSFPTPTGLPTVGAGLQNFRVWVRKTNHSTNPTATVELFESGSSVATIVASTSITSTTGQILAGSFNANLLGTSSGANVECRVVGTVGGGTPGNRASVEVGAVEWNVDYTAVQTFNQSTSDTVGLSEPLTPKAQKVQATSDSLGLSENLQADLVAAIKGSRSRRFAYLFFDDRTRIRPGVVAAPDEQATADTAAFTESVRLETRKVLAETPTLTESDAAQVQKQVLENLGLTDAVTPLGIKVRADAETVILTELVQLLAGKALGETPSLGESLSPAAIVPPKGSRARRYAYLFFDDRTRVRSGIGTTTEEQGTDDTLGLTESVRREVAKFLAETPTFTEADLAEARTSILESLGLTENLTPQGLKVRADAETVILTELVRALVGKAIGETPTLTESLTPAGILPPKGSRARRFAYLFFDDRSRVRAGVAVALTQAAQDTVALTELLRAQVGKALAETPGLSEDLRGETRRVIAESPVLTEALGELAAKLKTIPGETAALTEGLARLVSKAVTENLSVAELVQRKTVKLPIAETVVLSESLGSTVGGDVTQSDFRWRDDDGDENGASWLAVQNADISRNRLVSTRLRIAVNAAGDPNSEQYQLEYKNVLDSEWEILGS